MSKQIKLAVAAFVALAAAVACFEHIQYVSMWVGESVLNRWIIPITFDALAVIAYTILNTKGAEEVTPRQRTWAKRTMVAGLSASLIGNVLAAVIRTIQNGNLFHLDERTVEFIRFGIGVGLSVWPVIALYLVVEMLFDTHKKPNQAKPGSKPRATGRKAAGTPATGKPILAPTPTPIVVPDSVQGALNGHVHAN